MQNALRMQAQVTGSGAPLVLIGGGLTGWLGWEPHAALLATTRKVIRLQLLSVQYGLEQRPLPADYSVKTESRAMAAALDSVGLEGPQDLVAWSYGALVTLDFALDNPDRVRSLTLIEPPALWVLDRKTRNSREIQETETLLRSLRGDITEAQLEGFLVAVGICPPGVSARELPQWPVWLRHRLSLRNSQAPLDHRDSPRRLISFRHPVLLVTGTGTAPFLLRIIETLQAQLPQARTVEMPGAHAPQIVAMDRFLHELATFLANLK